MEDLVATRGLLDFAGLSQQALDDDIDLTRALLPHLSLCPELAESLHRSLQCSIEREQAQASRDELDLLVTRVAAEARG